ncbi:ribonuclease R [Rhodothermus profundi]|uniref:Ribonuclease R n=1 Tax=Rhodothermus profundi TaxID=633813 RepID=A0A1M6P8C2_9BACT|nr:ribonuclease R [Rhodothermus profundi]SHK04169.1 RNAse R [Rhodothermus profundi]
MARKKKTTSQKKASAAKPKRSPTRLQIRRAILSLLRNNAHRAYRPKELAKLLALRDYEAYQRFWEVLSELEHQHLIARVKGGRYTYERRPYRVEGILRVHPQGYGFVEIQGQEEEDIYISEAHMGTALDGDRVLVGLAAPARGDRRREGEVLKVLERRRTRTVGTFHPRGAFALVVPDDPRLTRDIYVPREAFNGAHAGDKVVVSIDRFDDPKGSPEGRVLEVLGPASDPRVQVLALALSKDVRTGFPEAVLQEAARIPETIPEREYRRRLDLRDREVFTIDPSDAKDFDDALHLRRLPNGHIEVGVHIADVSYYVRPGSALDEEAYQRGTSVYLVDRVIPMLPEKLSNQVCSLRPGEDKLTYSVLIELTPAARVVRYQIRETIIHSRQRFTYEEAQSIIDGADHPLAEPVRLAHELAQRLRAARMQAGAIDFDLPEVKVELDEAGNPVRIYRKARLAAHQLIEEFMLLANRLVAETIGKRPAAPPFVYRIHDRPDAEKIRQLAHYVRVFGYRLEIEDGSVSSKALNELLQHVKGTPEEPVIEEAALRAMAKARYSTQNIGHYGLAFDFYTHFTSPIRRYPDLMVHRLLKAYLKKGTSASAVDADALEMRCQHCSERERAAEEAERDSIRLKQVQYMQQHVGDCFRGVVSSVTNFGVFVELEDVWVEGLVHVRDMGDDYYEYDERRYTLRGLYTGKRYRPGDVVEVMVVRADPATRQIDLRFVEPISDHESQAATPRRRRRRKRAQAPGAGR